MKSWRFELFLLLTIGWLSGVPLQAAELMVCWGNTGDIPAVALLEAGREPRVLVPGGVSDAMMLASCLEKEGLLQVSEMLMPTWSPFPKGAAKIAEVCAIRQLVVVYESRSRTRWTELREKLVAAGTAVVTRYPQVKHCWRIYLSGDLLVEYQRTPGTDCFRLRIITNFDDISVPVYYCEELDTGVFAVGRERDAKPILELPKSNHSGMRRVVLE